MSDIADKIELIKQQLPLGVNLVAVSKYHPVEMLQQAYDAGQRIFGENHVQELVAKAPHLPGDVQWHMIGHLQTNKVRMLMPHVSMIQSIDSVKLLRTVEKEAARIDRVVDVLLQLHVARETTKTGFATGELLSVLSVGELNDLPHVRIRGLMAMATNTDDQFLKSGFDEKRFFRTQGSYAKMQCSKACHDRLYDNEELVLEMIEKTDDDLKIPSELVPICPVCGEEMDLNLRKDSFFVEDDTWNEQNQNYIDFIEKALKGNLLLMEFGIGFNTPIIIRFPFDGLMESNENVNLARFNRSHLEMTIQQNGNYYLVGEEKIGN